LGHPLSSVELVESAIEDADIPAVDAVLFSLTHDVLQSPPSLDAIRDHLRPGGRVASFGAKTRRGPRAATDRRARLVARRYVTTFDNFDAPWRPLAERVADLEVRRFWLASPTWLGASGADRGRAGRRGPGWCQRWTWRVKGAVRTFPSALN
jgi:hypothetical protein